MFDFFQPAAKQEEKPKRVIGIKPIYNGHEEKTALVPDFSKERSAVLEKANSEAIAIIERAQAEKKRIMDEAAAWQAEWHQEKERLQSEAYEKGFAQGESAGREAGFRETSGLIAEAKSVVESSKIEYEKNVERSEQTILELALLCAEKVLHGKLEKETDLFMGIVRAAVKEVRDQKEVQIHVHPSKYNLVVAQKDEIEAMFPQDVKCYVFPNEEAKKDSCFIETANGRIDASVDTQLQQLRATLFDVLGSS